MKGKHDGETIQRVEADQGDQRAVVGEKHGTRYLHDGTGDQQHYTAGLWCVRSKV